MTPQACNTLRSLHVHCSQAQLWLSHSAMWKLTRFHAIASCGHLSRELNIASRQTWDASIYPFGPQYLQCHLPHLVVYCHSLFACILHLLPCYTGTRIPATWMQLFGRRSGHQTTRHCHIIQVCALPQRECKFWTETWPSNNETMPSYKRKLIAATWMYLGAEILTV